MAKSAPEPARVSNNEMLITSKDGMLSILYKTVQFKLRGLTPLLMASNKIAILSPKGPSGQGRVKASKEEVAASLVYRNQAGNLYFPTAGFRKSLMGGGKGRKFGKDGATSLLSNSISLAPDHFETELINPKTGKPITEYEIQEDVGCTGKPPNQKRIPLYRPKIWPWAATVTFGVDDSLISTDEILNMFARAGSMVGIGAWRPEKQGVYGKYEVALGTW